jgi:hypothetical protein
LSTIFLLLSTACKIVKMGVHKNLSVKRFGDKFSTCC